MTWIETLQAHLNTAREEGKPDFWIQGFAEGWIACINQLRASFMVDVGHEFKIEGMTLKLVKTEDSDGR